MQLSYQPSIGDLAAALNALLGHEPGHHGADVLQRLARAELASAIAAALGITKTGQISVEAADPQEPAPSGTAGFLVGAAAGDRVRLFVDHAGTALDVEWGETRFGDAVAQAVFAEVERYRVAHGFTTRIQDCVRRTLARVLEGPVTYMGPIGGSR